jgi:YfiH family protein
MACQFLTSQLLPVMHGFTTREGGVSEGAYHSLNVSLNVGDARERVVENLRRVAAAAGLEPFQLQSAAQVHGDRVLELREPDPRADPGAPLEEADALWTSHSGSAVAVRIADCVPILLVDPKLKRVAAVHSGWRGTELQIVAQAVGTLTAQGTRAADLLVAIGPSIRSCCYRVSPELAARFAKLFGNEVVRFAGGAQHLDLASAIQGTLLRTGVAGDHIDLLPSCTSCDARRFFSHRRDGGLTGRQMAFAVCRF